MSRKTRRNELTGTADDRLERDLPNFMPEPGPGGSRLAKEAKIGLAAIIVLVVVFGTLLYKRFSDDEAPAATVGANNPPEEPGEPPESPQAPRPFQPSWTVVAAKADDDPTGHTASIDFNSSSLPDGGRANAFDNATGNPASPPAFAPPIATSEDPYARQASMQAGAAAGTGQNVELGGAGGHPPDPFPEQASNAETMGGDAHGLRAIEVQPQSPVGGYGSQPDQENPLRWQSGQAQPAGEVALEWSGSGSPSPGPAYA
ncbi:MAG: hypothetical protein ACYTG0_45220, partial [Planctomycetota bacterium]